MEATLFDAQTSNGSSDGFYHDGNVDTHFWVHGTWNTATVTLEQRSPDGSTFVPVDGAEFTDNVNSRITTSTPGIYRLTLSSVGASTSLSAYARSY